jgi:single-strand DNA-binding protein
MSHEITGRLCEKFDSVQISEKLIKREFVIETEEKFPQQIKFELMNDKCGLIDAYQIGDNLKVSFNLRGREWNGKYFVNLQAWKIEREGQSETHTPNPIADMTPADEDLPF